MSVTTIKHIMHLCLWAPLAAFLLAGCGFWGQMGRAKPELTPPASVRTHKVVRTAYKQMGKRYRAGGSSPQHGFDCSGLVWWTYGQHGIKVPRIAVDQAKSGHKVSKQGARPGDILVFRTGLGPRSLHTGIYCGEEKFIHSPSSGKVVCLESLSLPYWKDRLVGIRRVMRQMK